MARGPWQSRTSILRTIRARSNNWPVCRAQLDNWSRRRVNNKRQRTAGRDGRTNVCDPSVPRTDFYATADSTGRGQRNGGSTMASTGCCLTSLPASPRPSKKCQRSGSKWWTAGNGSRPVKPQKTPPIERLPRDWVHLTMRPLFAPICLIVDCIPLPSAIGTLASFASAA